MLLQGGRPTYPEHAAVIYVSCTLMPAQEHYSNIQRTVRSGICHGETV